MQDLIIKPCDIPELSSIIATLDNTGTLALSKEGLTYLSIHPDYIHKIFSLLPNGVIKPNYFCENNIGAHIGVIYPEEKVKPNAECLGQTHVFHTAGLYTACVKEKCLYVLKVIAPSLITFRKKHGLPEKLKVYGYTVGLHITVGVKN